MIGNLCPLCVAILAVELNYDYELWSGLILRIGIGAGGDRVCLLFFFIIIVYCRCTSR